MSWKADDFKSEPDCKASLALLDPHVRLAAGVLAKAAEEAERGDPGAVQWLASDEACLYSQVIGIDYQAILRQVKIWASSPSGQLVIRVYSQEV